MVNVVSSKGGFVNVEIKGVSEVLTRIRALGKDVNQGADVGVFQAANMMQQEVQESIIGNRAEHKSVLTGNLGNSITVNKIKDAEYIVYTDVEYAKKIEYSPSIEGGPRRHFTNSVFRNKDRAKEIIKEEIKRKI